MSNRKYYSPLSLTAELELVHRQVSVQNTEKSIEQGVIRLIECCDNGGCEFVTEMLAGIRSLSRPLNRAINSDRNRLSCLAIELVIALLAGLSTSFEPLIALFLPTLLGLCARTNKAFTTPAKACVFAVIRGTKSPSLLPYLVKSLDHKSPSVRLVAAEGVLAYLDCVNHPDIVKDTRQRPLEAVIKLTTRDPNADVRQAGKKIFEIYKALLPGRVESFVAPLSPVTKKHLAVQGMATSQLTSQVLPRNHRASESVRPFGPLSTQKSPSSQHSEKRTHSLSFEPRQGTHVVRPIITSTEMSSGPQLSSMQNRDQRRGVTHPSASITQRLQRVGDMSIDKKLHLKGNNERITIPTAPQPDNSMKRAIRKTSLPASNPTSRAEFPVTTKTRSVNSTSVTIKRSSWIGPLPVAKAEPHVARGTSSRTGKVLSYGTPLTEAEVQTSSHACRRRVIAPRFSEQANGQDKPVWGGRPVSKGRRPVVKALSGGMKNPDTSKALRHPSPIVSSTAVSSPARSPRQLCLFEAMTSRETSVQATSIHIPRDLNRPYTEVTSSRCDVTIAIPKTSLVRPVHHEDLFASSHDGYAPSSVPDRLRRVPIIPRSIWNYRKNFIADTPSPCGVLPEESHSTPSNKGSSSHRDNPSAPNVQHPRPFQLPPSKLPPFKPFELPPLPPFEFPLPKLPPFKPFEMPPLPPFEFPLPKLPLSKPFELPPFELPPSKPIKPFEIPPFEIPLSKLPPFKPFQLPPLPPFELPPSNLPRSKPFELPPSLPRPYKASSIPPVSLIREILDQLPTLKHAFRIKY